MYTYEQCISVLCHLRSINRDNLLTIRSASHSVHACGIGSGNLKNGSNGFDHTAFTDETNHSWFNELQLARAGGLRWGELYLQITTHMDNLQWKRVPKQARHVTRTKAKSDDVVKLTTKDVCGLKNHIKCNLRVVLHNSTAL